MKNPFRTVSPYKVTAIPVALLIVLVAIGPSAVASDEHAGEEPGHASTGEHSTKGLHEVMIFGGATDDRGEWAGTLGAEYGYSFMDGYAVGAFFDHAGGQLRSSVVGLAFWAKVSKGFGVMFGPAVEFLKEGPKRHFLARFGVGYSVHVGKRYTLMPVVHADFVDEHVIWVTGLNFGIRFGKKMH